MDNIEKSFSDMYRQEVDALFRFCLQRTSDREKAIELTQETFSRYWEAVANGKSIDNPRAFIYKVARNLVIDWYRKKKPVSLDAKFFDEDENDYDVPDEKAHKLIEINTDASRVLSMLEKLDEEYRDVIYFRYLEDFSPQEIAEVLGLNANTVSIRITRGMDALRKIMGISKKNYE